MMFLQKGHKNNEGGISFGTYTLLHYENKRFSRMKTIMTDWKKPALDF